MAFNFQTRRATIDDLTVLRNLWRQAGHPVPLFEKALTDFQVVETADGIVLGTLGLQIEAQQGRIYGQARSDPELATELLPRLWKRVLTLARQHRLTQLWVESGAGVFWLDQGFELAGTEALQSLPPGFPRKEGHPWLMLQIREELPSRVQAELELELLHQTQVAHRERAIRRARLLRGFAVVVAALVLLAIMGAGWYVLRLLSTSR
ncbi:MAG: hypothetical protein AB9869_25690 [Verrucomicrobiia bacterium]